MLLYSFKDPSDSVLWMETFLQLQKMGDDMAEVSTTGFLVIETKLQNVKPLQKFTEESHKPYP